MNGLEGLLKKLNPGFGERPPNCDIAIKGPNNGVDLICRKFDTINLHLSKKSKVCPGCLIPASMAGSFRLSADSVNPRGIIELDRTKPIAH